jgi:predicted transposase YbfD/YdcC
MPSHHTIRRLFADILDEDDFEHQMRAYRERQRAGQAERRLLAVDGKRERGTIPPGESQGEATVAVYDPEGQEVIAQAAVTTGEGEIPTAQRVLAEVDLHNKIVLADALHTQRQLCQQVVENGGDYVLTIKENQPLTYQAIASLFDPAAPNRALLVFQTACKTNKGHGRIEQRRLTAVSLWPGEIDWPAIQQVFRLERSFTYLRRGAVLKVTNEVHFGLTSLPRPRASADRLLYLKRKYWQIENGLHYRRDVTFHEDATRMSHPHATRNLTTVHNTILSLFARLGCRNAAQTRRRLDADLRLAFSLLTSAHPRL